MGIEGNANHTNTGSTPLHAGGDGGNAAAAVAGAAVVNQFTSTAMHLSSLPEYGAAASGTGEADSGSTTSRFVTSPQIATSVATDVDNIGTSPHDIIN
ncbi:hypothetical protein EV182_005854 [Spiromyces aspiralis]|uniref:Uncharacterized protein n=1 Tax=Spiromyces aspiralis TaxID=68401 RepID=A0ACC1HQH8_9FUNG|nr:hypothetical protein EV182_005854 [Spiromyces aspiralis]